MDILSQDENFISGRLVIYKADQHCGLPNYFVE
jgi:hypothetical protein